MLVALSIVAPSINPGNILSVLGFGGVASGFAFKDILQIFLAGIVILLQEPSRVGDQIVFKTFEGTVEQIDTRSTKIKTYDGRLVIIPNGDLFVNSVIVNTAFHFRRSEYDVGIGYGDSVEQARDVILTALATIDGVLDEPAPDVIPFELALNLKARWWSDSKRSDVVRARGDVITVLKAAIDKAQIDLPFQQALCCSTIRPRRPTACAASSAKDGPPATIGPRPGGSRPCWPAARSAPRRRLASKTTATRILPTRNPDNWARLSACACRHKV